MAKKKGLKGRVGAIRKRSTPLTTKPPTPSTPATPPLICTCGSQLFERSLRTGGWWKQLVNGFGEVVETNLNSVRYGREPKTVKCVECGKVNRNPSFK